MEAASLRQLLLRVIIIRPDAGLRIEARAAVASTDLLRQRRFRRRGVVLAGRKWSHCDLRMQGCGSGNLDVLCLYVVGCDWRDILFARAFLTLERTSV